MSGAKDSGYSEFSVRAPSMRWVRGQLAAPDPHPLDQHLWEAVVFLNLLWQKVTKEDNDWSREGHMLIPVV